MSKIPPFKPLPSGLIVPQTVAYDLEIRVFFNTKTGNTEMQLFSESLKEFNTLQIAGVLSEHATAMLRGIVSGALKVVPVTKGASDGNKPQA